LNNGQPAWQQVTKKSKEWQQRPKGAVQKEQQCPKGTIQNEQKAKHRMSEIDGWQGRGQGRWQ
jgi:hypothetical protein